MVWKPNRSKLGILLLSCLMTAALFWTAFAESNNVYASIAKNLNIIGEIFKQVNQKYVEHVDPDKFLKAAIDGMLSTLDPYTTYIEKEDKFQLQIMTEGKYDGVGLSLQYRDNIVTVGEPPFIGTPSARAGIREGDRIIKVNGKLTSKLGFSETAQMVRGPAGTEVTLTIEREGEKSPLEFTLIREHIQIDDIRYAGVIDDSIGYILLTHFSQNASREVRQAVQDLESRGIKGLIFDLRGNPGGILEAAVNVSDIFLDKKDLIVSRKGRTKESTEEYFASQKPLYSGPLAVLMNRFSASASEIVAGALKDNDRAIVVGDTSFGKGLVQSVIPLSENTALKITTAKYYTPSGRCIQRSSMFHSQDSTDQNDSKSFKTKNGRTVTSGGGIAPDIYILQNERQEMAVDLRRKSQFFNFAVHYSNTHAVLDSNFQITDDIMQSFQQYLKDRHYVFEHPIEKDLRQLRTECIQNGYGSQFLANIDQLQNSMKQLGSAYFKSSEDDIRQILKQELASKYFGVRREVEIALEADPVVNKAEQVLHDPVLYKEILTPVH